MRTDITKVSFDGHGPKCLPLRPGRPLRDPELEPVRQKMTHHSYGLHGLHPKPLVRWLQAQVGRSWDAVYSELSAKTHSSGNVGRTLEQLVLGKVEVHNVEMRDGWAWVTSGTYTREPYKVEGLYVHPKTRVLCHQTYRSKAVREASERRKAESLAKRKVLTDTLQLHKLDDGLWYAVELAPIPTLSLCKVPHWPRLPNGGFGDVVYREEPNYTEAARDVLTGQSVYRMPNVKRRAASHAMAELYGNGEVYGARKRQLSHKELKRYGLLG